MAAKRISEDLLGPLASNASPEALSAEIIRVALWTQSTGWQAPSLSEASVTTQQILKLARAIWRPVASTDDTDAAKKNASLDSDTKESGQMNREILEDLAENGDLLELSGGRWLPAPLRLVRVSPTRHLLVAGMPTRLLLSGHLNILQLHGSFRYVANSPNSSLLQAAGIPVQWQSLESWLGPAQTLEELARLFEEQNLLAVSRQNTSDTSLEAYDASINTPQYSRWRSLDHIVRDGRYLLRTSTPWGLNHYTIGFITKRRLAQQSGELYQVDIRRLCYALDHRAGKPTIAQWDQRRSLLTLHSELPGRERKFLSTIGMLIENKDGKYYPRAWLITQDADHVFSMLKDLGITIKQAF
jgi:hypothetical protein